MSLIQRICLKNDILQLRLQLASYDLAAMWQKKRRKSKFQYSIVIAKVISEEGVSQFLQI